MVNIDCGVNSQFHWSKRHWIKWLVLLEWISLQANSNTRHEKPCAKTYNQHAQQPLNTEVFIFDYHFIVITFYLKLNGWFGCIVRLTFPHSTFLCNKTTKHTRTRFNRRVSSSVSLLLWQQLSHADARAILLVSSSHSHFTEWNGNENGYVHTHNHALQWIRKRAWMREISMESKRRKPQHI